LVEISVSLMIRNSKTIDPLLAIVTALCWLISGLVIDLRF